MYLNLRPIVLLLLVLGTGCTETMESSECDAEPLACEDVVEGEMCPSTCETPDWSPGTCESGQGERQEVGGNTHIDLPDPLSYSNGPPTSGDHRPMWACWGEYSYLSPTRWLHNLEHGGIAILYHPCAGPDVVDELREYARNHPGDAAGPFRWIMTPYAGLRTTLAVVSWGWIYSANCLRPAELDAFVSQRYRQAPEDIGSDGVYSKGYLGR